MNPDGRVIKYTSRLVAKGFTQSKGNKYGQTFIPAARMTTIHSVLNFFANEKTHFAKFDISTAFWYGEFEEIIYMVLPRGYGDGTDRMRRHKELVWHQKGNKMLEQKILFILGFREKLIYVCLFSSNSSEDSGNTGTLCRRRTSANCNFFLIT